MSTDPSHSDSFGPRPTLRQIASAAGVSAMTVSRALRDSPRVADALKRAIRAKAEELGYRPDPQVSKLMNHLRRRQKSVFMATLAAITSIQESIEPHEFKKARATAQRRAEELGYRLDLFRVQSPQRFNRQLQRTLINRGIEGVVLMQQSTPTQVDELLDWEKFSVVIASPSVIGPEFSRVGANYFHNARLVCSHLAAKGCKRIGFVGPETFCIRTGHAFDAAAAWQNMAAGGSPVPALVVSSRLPSRQEFTGWMKRERPDGIIFHSSEAVSVLSDTLPLNDVARPLFACTNIDPEAPHIPGVDERHDIIGQKAIDVLTGLINRSEKNHRTLHTSTLVNGQWVEQA